MPKTDLTKADAYIASLIVDCHEAGPPEGGEFGTPAVMIEKDQDCQQCGRVHDIEACPECGSDIGLGFGLGFGPGMGDYKFCEAGCGWHWKNVWPEED